MAHSKEVFFLVCSVLIIWHKANDEVNKTSFLLFLKRKFSVSTTSFDQWQNR